MDLPGLRASEGPTPEKRQLNQLKQGLGNDPRLNECGQYPMARTRSENYDGIHLGILTNAAALFSAQGYMRSSIADLAEACKLSRGALYHYFDSKEAILFAILDAHIREMILHVETAVAAGGPTLAQVRNLIPANVKV